MNACGAAERIPCVLIDAHIAAKSNPKICSSFEGCHGTIEHFDLHRANADGGHGQYKVRLEVPQSKQPTGRLSPGGMFSTGDVRYSGGKVVWLDPRHVLVRRMTAVTVVPTSKQLTFESQLQSGPSNLDDRVAASSGRVVGYVRGCVRGNLPGGTTTGGDGRGESVQDRIEPSRKKQTQPELAAVSMSSMLEYVLRGSARRHDF